ncbi:DKNYY domain-containing protein [Aequorivita sp. Q41]|uniref:DKNYY domain-containing protein n=1 Tax=Aequorivita sp. Q41 TaxID=3153300 RepID=UPI0032421E23
MTENFTFKNNKVYYKDTLLKGISAEGFGEVLFTDKKGEHYNICLKDIKGVWWWTWRKNKPSVKFLSSDIDNFTYINADFAIDSRYVYLIAKDGFLIPNSDAKTFKVLEDTPYFAKDKNNLYALSSISGLSIYRDADCESIVSVGWNQFITDKHNVYHYAEVIELSNSSKHVECFDHNTPPTSDLSIYEQNKKYLLEKYPNLIGWWHPEYEFNVAFPTTNQDGYFKTETHIFYLHKHPYGDKAYPTLIEKADVSSFEILSHYYARDKNHLYCEHRIVENVDLDSFKVIKDSLAEDEHSIFFNGYLVDCDKASFRVIQKSSNLPWLVAKDKNSVFIATLTLFGQASMRTGKDQTLKPIFKSDPSTFQLFSRLWAKDTNQVYFDYKPYRKADAKSFEFLFSDGDDEWAKDNQYVYNGNGKRILKNIDGAHFKMLNNFWGKDKKSVFNFKTGSIRPSIDVASFQIINDAGDAADKNFVYSYRNGEIIKKKQ